MSRGVPCTIQMSLDKWLRATDGMIATAQAGPRNIDIGSGMRKALNVNDLHCQREFSSASMGDGRWSPLAKSTIRQRQRMGQTGIGKVGFGSPTMRMLLTAIADVQLPILIITGQKYESLVEGAPYHVAGNDDNSMWSGSNAPNLAFHQRGNSRLPKRPVIIPPDQPTNQAMKIPLVASTALAWRKAIQT